jgi:hypothetical protein
VEAFAPAGPVESVEAFTPDEPAELPDTFEPQLEDALLAPRPAFAPSHAPSTTDPGVVALADRLQHVADRLRREGAAGLSAGFGGDRFDAVLAGFLAGYLAARD